MKESMDTLIYREMSVRFERLAEVAFDKDELPPYVFKLTPAQQREVEKEKAMKELAQRYVGGM